MVEDNLDDHTVGWAGLPNLLGGVELDASIMDGRTLTAGAVAALKGYPNPISVARRVMNDLPHVLLAGESVARFAAESGFEPANLLTDETRRIWQERLEGTLPPNATPGDRAFYAKMREWARPATDPEKVSGTVNFIARDANGTSAGVANREATYIYMPDEMETYVEAARMVIAPLG